MKKMNVKEWLELVENEDEDKYLDFMSTEAEKSAKDYNYRKILKVIEMLDDLYDEDLCDNHYISLSDEDLEHFCDMNLDWDDELCEKYVLRFREEKGETQDDWNKAYDIFRKSCKDIRICFKELYDKGQFIWNFFKDFKITLYKDWFNDDGRGNEVTPFDVTTSDSDMILIRINKHFRDEYELILHDARKANKEQLKTNKE